MDALNAVTFLATLLWTTTGSPKPLPRSASVLASQLLGMLQTVHLVILLPTSRSTKWSRVDAYLGNTHAPTTVLYTCAIPKTNGFPVNCGNYGCCQFSSSTFVDDNHITKSNTVAHSASAIKRAMQVELLLPQEILSPRLLITAAKISLLMMATSPGLMPALSSMNPF